MSLERYTDGSGDSLYDALDDLQDRTNDVDERFVDERGPEVARELANAKKALTRAKEHRANKIEGVES